MSKSIQEAVKGMLEEDDELVPLEFSNLILDNLQIGEISEEDKTFLEQF